MSSFASTSRWSLDYSIPAPKSVPDPPGFLPPPPKGAPKNATALIKPVDLSQLRQQKAWELATAPAKNVPMQAFMMYMTGGGVQIFSVMSVWFLLKGAVGGIFGVEKAFAAFPTAAKPDTVTPSYLLQKATFVACQVALLAVGMWKMNNMGLLPTHSSDWLAFREWPVWEDVTSVSRGLH